MATPGDFDDVLPWFRFFSTKTKYDEGTTVRQRVSESGPGLQPVFYNHQCSQFNLWLCINNSYTLFCHRRPFLYSFFSSRMVGGVGHERLSEAVL